MNINKCPIWNYSNADRVTEHGPTVSITQNKEEYEINSQKTGGKYHISYQTYKRLKENPEFSKNLFRAKLTTWLIEQKKQGEESPQITDNVLEKVQQRNHLPINERINNLLKYIQEENEKNEENEFPQSVLKAYAECANDNEWYVMLDELRQYADMDQYAGEHPLTITLNAKGLKRLESLETNKDSRQAFVAMWFDENMNDIYDKAIQPAIEEMGYKSMRIDRKEHNNKIDDEIIAEIKRSKFLVADFSYGKDGIRGGVYYEAGFARNLGIPVIFTCRKENKNNLHFDTRQFKHTIWKNAEDLKKQLRDRIGATLGDGPSKLMGYNG